MSAVIRYFTLCERIIQEQATNRPSIIGLFDRLTAMVYPTKVESCQMILGLVGLEKPLKIRIRLVAPSNQIIMDFETKAEAKSLMHGANIIADLNGFTIPSVGTYWFEVYMDDDLRERFPFIVDYPIKEPKELSPSELKRVLSDPEAIKSVRINAKCGKCQKEYIFQHNLDPSMPISEDAQSFPSDGFFECPCGFKVDMTAIFRQAISSLGQKMPSEKEAAAGKE